MTTFTNTIRSGAIALAAFALVGFAFVPVARASDLDGWTTIDTSFPMDFDGGWSTIDTSYPMDYYSGGWSTIDTSYPMDYGYTSWSPSSFGGFGGFGGGFGGGGSSWTSTNNLVTNNGNTSIYAPSNTNICTGGNVCNNNSVFNAPTTVTVAGASTPVYQPPVVYSQPYPYPVYTPSVNTGCGYTVVCPTPTYRQPYVSLSATPYTGLELGPVGTVLYWSFLVLWCLAAAYLIAVKKVQNTIVAKLNHFLFPAAAGHAHTAHAAHAVHHAPAKKAHSHVEAPVHEGIDPFVASQINRSR